MSDIKGVDWEQKETKTQNPTQEDLSVLIKREKRQTEPVQQIIIKDEPTIKHQSIGKAFMSLLIMTIVVVILYLGYTTFRPLNLKDLSKHERNSVVTSIADYIIETKDDSSTAQKRAIGVANTLKELGINHVTTNDVKQMFIAYMNDDSTDKTSFSEALAISAGDIAEGLKTVKYKDMVIDELGISYGYTTKDSIISGKITNNGYIYFEDLAEDINAMLK